MRAWQIEGGFGLSSLRQVALPSVLLSPGQVRVAVRAVSLNYRDLLMVNGQYDPRQPLPLVPCSDAVGVVTEVGEGVAGVAVGERVCTVFNHLWRGGELDRSMMRGTLGGPLPGTLGEELVVKAAGVVRAPAHLSDEACATLPCAAVTAWRALVVEGRVKAGDVVLTLGTGGVSLFAVQLGRMLGATVIVTSSSDAKLARALALGAHHGLNYRADPSWGAAALRYTGGRGVDVVVELGGAETLEQSLRAVRPGGTVALIGVLSGAKVPVLLTRIFMSHVRVQGIFVGSREDLCALVRALEAHPDVEPVIDRVFPFDEAPRAFEHLASASHMGKIVVRVAP
jgi:NADPH:quinone reductase-like Zn-dependent oxidoreductase